MWLGGKERGNHYPIQKSAEVKWEINQIKLAINKNILIIKQNWSTKVQSRESSVTRITPDFFPNQLKVM